MGKRCEEEELELWQPGLVALAVEGLPFFLL